MKDRRDIDPQTPRESLGLFIKGLSMGAADLVPGVSGGTVAFITGIYDKLIYTVSSFDRAFFKKLFSKNWKLAINDLPLVFIALLASGMLISIFSLARLMNYLINDHPLYTWGFFFGMILGSIVIMGRKLENLRLPANLLSLMGGTGFAYFIIGLIPVETPNTPWFYSVCGMIGITAMILPGISGSFLLLILGKYEPITAAVKSPFSPGNLSILLFFSTGTLIGLLSFSKVLNYLLCRFRAITMAFLTGILIGSLRKGWPWKEVLQSKIVGGKVRVLEEANYLPDSWSEETLIVLALIIIAFIFIILLEQKSKTKGQ